MPIETHPFSIFVPGNAKTLILGSFAGWQVFTDESYDWYYGTGRNQFCLPSPSPRYARMSKEEKIARYIELLPGPEA